MKAPDTTGKSRKPQLNIALEAAEKKLVEDVAKARGVTVSSLVRMLAFDEARRLKIALPGTND
ncbi:hypothetical protein [Hymenobacter perfusus]|uniref:Ribbon-helix-helix protein, CopG family n=1 Tax=Hymenobacter perfusus TaxID=1236770 RepID=A0A3R9NY69_9BACT|nr:hypothetical protein [Hymenobacter perfusus]RSK46108.1 hypothetical protein EI293_02760 [Hymenobacter perfusus]